ncbi:NAD(P)H-dependent oxidoreductase [Mesoterricola sediminis]|uniref:NAD(P)H dehydrogenase n=1 Tax=Mesoterricola sediminis TaxID=2927980 RepID=A0AA48GUP2_9BACT|nr:NAD(P)H-dependent oxidoreductase [Mesoterricola sediminis]BDU76574.1 NAD(P)H dehydrogenase [Mesoterricola sediminis]
MRVLIVYAHEEPLSFNGAMRDLAVRELEALGHAVTVSDLYAMGWKAVADAQDFLERRDRHVLKRQAEEVAALGLGTLAHDILEEQRKLREADVVIFQFPLWWFSLPAILKGWVDRVMTMGFAYGAGMRYATGGLRGRRALLALTTGGAEAAYAGEGGNGSMDAVLFPIQHGILSFCGFQTLPPFVAWAPAHQTPEAREAVLEAWRARLRGLEAEG